MPSFNQNIDPLKDLTDQEIEDLIKSNEVLDQEEARIIQEDIEEKARRELETNSPRKFYKRLKKSPLEIINRSFFFIFLGSFLFSFFSVYTLNRWWFLLYVISAFSCILYTPNRKALKELIAAWPNIEELIMSSKK
tara:strand:+ start:775 stop:1182 length:408 start_codon:yes stop_codon:yes gene_type:complete